MSKYQELARRAWRTGDYKAAPVGGGRDEFQDAEELRSFLRSKMEWIVEREAYDPREAAAPREESKMKLAQFVKFREEKFGGVLFETRSEKVYTLSPTGAAVVKELAAGGGDADIVGRLKARYEDQGGGLEAEATAFLAELKAKGLITE